MTSGAPGGQGPAVPGAATGGDRAVKIGGRSGWCSTHSSAAIVSVPAELRRETLDGDASAHGRAKNEGLRRPRHDQTTVTGEMD